MREHHSLYSQSRGSDLDMDRYVSERCRIPDKEQETFALAGILTFTDKVISKETKQYIKEVLGMTQVGKMLLDAGIQKGRQEEATQTTINMLRS